MTARADRSDPPCKRCMMPRSAHVCPCGLLLSREEHALHPNPPAGDCNYDPVRLMNLVEAMKWSRETGETFTRYESAFTKYVVGFVYEFTDEEVLADDWESCETFIPRLTGGRWGSPST